MTVLVDWQIREEIETGRLLVSPYDSSLVNPSSLDIRLGDEFGEIFPTGKYKASMPVDLHVWDEVPIIDLTRQDSFDYKKIKSEVYVIPPRGCVLAVAVERLHMPDDISCKVVGKSSWARVFLDNSSAGGWAECGFPGSLVLEIVNYTNYYQKLTAGMKCAQLVFEKHEPAETAYDKHEKSRYKNQVGLQGSKGV